MTGISAKEIFGLKKTFEERLQQNELIQFSSRCNLPDVIVNLNIDDRMVKLIKSGTRNNVAQAHEATATEAVATDWLH